MSNASVSNVVPRVQTTIPIEKVTEMMDASSGILSDILSGFGVWNKSEADQFAQNKLTEAAKAASAGSSLPKGDQLAVDLVVPMATVALDIAQKFKSIESGNFSTDSGIIDIPIEIQNAISQDKNKFIDFTRSNKGMLLGLLKMASRVISINAEKVAQVIEDYAPIIIGGIGTLSTIAVASSVPPPYGPIAVAGVTLMGLKYLAMAKLSSMGLRGAARMLGGAIYDTMMDGGCGCTGGVSGGGLRRKLNIKGGAVGDNGVIAQYSDSANRAAKDSIVDNIISAMSALGFKVSTSGSRADKVAEIIKMLPSAKDIKNKDAGTQANTCKKIAAAINTAFATEIFNTNVDPVLLCQGVAEVLHSLASEVHSEFLVVIRNVRILLDNMIHIKEYLDQAFEMAMRSLEANDAKRGDAIKAKEVHKLLTDKLEQQILVLKNLFSTSISGTESAISGLIGDETALKSYIEKIDTKLGTGEFSDVIITMLRGMGITAQYAQVINEALKTIGMTMKEFGEATTYSDIAAKASDLLSKKDLNDRELNEYMKAVQLVYTNLPNAKKIAETLGTKGGCDSFTGGKRRGGSSLLGADEGEYEKTALDRRVENTEKLKNMIINTFYRQIATLFANIVTSLNELGKQIGKAVPLSEQLDGFRNAMGKISTTFVMHRGIYWALIGYYNDALSKSKKDTLMAELRIILVYLDELMAMPLYKDAAKQYFRAIHNNITALISTIDKYSDEISAKFGSASRFGGALGGGRVGGNANGGASLFGDPEVPPAMKAPVESVKFALGLGEAFRNFDFFYRAAQIKSNMSRTSAEFDSYSVGYKELTAKSIAAKIEEVNESYKSDVKHLEGLISSNADVYGKADVSKKEIEAAKQFMEAQYAARKKFWNTLEAVDTYMQLFTNGIIKNPDDIRDIRNMINDVEIINEWYTESSGDKITSVFDSFPSMIIGDSVAITENTKSLSGAIMPPASFRSGPGHYYSRIGAAAKTSTEPGDVTPGNPYIATDPTRGVDAARNLGGALRGINALKNLLSVFVNLGSKFGGTDINKAVFMKPAAMYKNLVEFLTFSSFAQGMSTSSHDRQNVMTIIDAMENLDYAGYYKNTNLGLSFMHFLDVVTTGGNAINPINANDKSFADGLDAILRSRSLTIDQKIQQVAGRFLVEVDDFASLNAINPQGFIPRAIRTDLQTNATHFDNYRTVDQLVHYINTATLRGAKFRTIRDWLNHLSSAWDKKDLKGRTSYIKYDVGAGKITLGNAATSTYMADCNSVNVGVITDNTQIDNIADFRARFGILMRAKIGSDFDKDRLLSGNFADEDEYFVLLLKSIAAKIFTVIGVYDLLDKPNEVMGLTPTRMIVGGNDSTPKINPALTELYFRLPLLAQFYRNLFGFDTDEGWNTYSSIKKKDTNMKISMVPEIDGVFSGLVNIIFRKTMHVNNNAYSDDDIKDLIGEINAIYAKLAPKFQADVTREIINLFVAEINRRYGVVTRTQRNIIENQINNRFNYTLEGAGGIGVDRYSGVTESINYPILPGEGDFDDDVPTIAPSDAYLSSNMENIKGRKSPYGISSDHYTLLRRFRCMIDNYFKDAKNDVTFTTSIKSTQQRMEGEQNDEEKLKIIGSLIRGVDAYSRADNIKYLMFHENVIAGLNALSAIHTILARFRNVIMAVSIDDVFPVMMDTLATWYGANGGPQGGAAFGKIGNTPDVFVEALRESYNKKFGGIEIDSNLFQLAMGRSDNYNYSSSSSPTTDDYVIKASNGIRVHSVRFGDIRHVPNTNQTGLLHSVFNGMEADEVAAHRSATGQFKDALEMFKWFVFPKELIMKLLIENIYLVTRDMQGLTSMRLDADNIVLNFGGLRKTVMDMFADVTANINLLRPHMNPDVIGRYTDKFRAGSLYWLHEQIVEKLFEGRDVHGTTTTMKEYVSLDKLSAKINNLFKYLTSESVYSEDGINTATMGVTVVRAPRPRKWDYGNILTDFVFYDSRKPSSGIYNSTAARNTSNGSLDDEPQLIDFMGRNDPIEQLICVGFLDKRALDTRYLARYKQLYTWNSELTENRSLLFEFNQLLAKYLHTCFDGAAQKVYNGAVNAFISGPFNHSIMNQEHTWPDTWPGYMVKPGKGRWTSDALANELYNTAIAEGGVFSRYAVGTGMMGDLILGEIRAHPDLNGIDADLKNTVYSMASFEDEMDNALNVGLFRLPGTRDLFTIGGHANLTARWGGDALGAIWNATTGASEWAADYSRHYLELVNNITAPNGAANGLGLVPTVGGVMPVDGSNAFSVLLAFFDYLATNGAPRNVTTDAAAMYNDHYQVIMACINASARFTTSPAAFRNELNTIIMLYYAKHNNGALIGSLATLGATYLVNLSFAARYVDITLANVRDGRRGEAVGTYVARGNPMNDTNANITAFMNANRDVRTIHNRGINAATRILTNAYLCGPFTDDLAYLESQLITQMRESYALTRHNASEYVGNVLYLSTDHLQLFMSYFSLYWAIRTGEFGRYVEFLRPKVGTTNRYSQDVQAALLVCSIVANFRRHVHGTPLKSINEFASISVKTRAPNEGEATKDTTSTMIPSSELLSGLNLDIGSTAFPPFDAGSLRLCSQNSGIQDITNTFELHLRKNNNNNYNWGDDQQRRNIGHLLDIDPDKLLFTSLSLILKNMIATKNVHSQPAYMYENIGDVPQYVKERYRGNMPAFRSLFKTLIARAEHMRQFIENKHINATREYSSGIDQDVRFENPWPGTSLANKGTDADSTRELLTRVCNNIIKGCTSLITCCDQVMRDLVDEPKYFETQLNGIKEYRQYNNTDPLMPLSSMLAVLKDDSVFKTAYAPFHELGTDEFKYLYGTRRILFQPDVNITIADAPGYMAIINDYNAGQRTGMFTTDETKMGSYFNNFVKLVRYANEYTNMKRLTSLIGSSATIDNHIDYQNDIPIIGELTFTRGALDIPTNTSIYSIFADVQHANLPNTPVKPVIQLSADMTLSSAISITESTNKNDMIKKIVGYVTNVDSVQAKMDVQNIIDMNIVPINVHAMMRELPLANLYNYAYTYDRMIVDLYYGEGTKNANKIINDLCKDDGHVKIKTSRDLMLALMLRPYRNVPHKEYNEHLRALMTGDSSVELGRPKFLSDQLYNKLLFGSMYESKHVYKESGPHINRTDPYDSIFAMGMSIIRKKGNNGVDPFGPRDMTLIKQANTIQDIFVALGGPDAVGINKAGRMFMAFVMRVASLLLASRGPITAELQASGLSFGDGVSFMICALANMYVGGVPRCGFGYNMADTTDRLAGRRMKGIYVSGLGRTNYAPALMDLSTAPERKVASAILFGRDATTNQFNITDEPTYSTGFKDSFGIIRELLAHVIYDAERLDSPPFGGVFCRAKWEPRGFTLDDITTKSSINTSSVLTYLEDQKNVLPANSNTDASGMYPDNMRVSNRAQIKEVDVSKVSTYLALLGRLRFDTMFTRNMIFIVNLYRSVRLKLNGELNYNREIVSRAREIVRPEITEFINNQVYEHAADYNYRTKW